MDSSTSSQNTQGIAHQKVIDLWNSNFPEDKELAEDARKVVAAIIEKLKPNLKYVCAPVSGLKRISRTERIRVSERGAYLGTLAELGSDSGVNIKLYLLEDGAAFAVLGMNGEDELTLDHSDFRRTSCFRYFSDWELCEFGKVVEALGRIYGEAERRREQHLDSIRRSREMLDRLVAVLKGGS